MATFTQAKRPIKVSTALGEDALLLAGFSGTESVSDTFVFTLDMLSENDALDAKKILRTPASVKITLKEGERVIHGRVRRFVQLGKHNQLIAYRAELVPWLWFLTLSSESKIYQNLTVPEIIEKVFKAQGYSDFTLKCTKTYDKREYCVQYQETHFNFVSRLMEEEGIFYFFEHTSSKHNLVLADAPGAFAVCPGQAKARIAVEGTVQNEDVIFAVSREHAVHSGKSTLRSYDPLQPALSLESSMAGSEKEEVYEYPGRFTKVDQGERYARLRVEAQEAQGQLLWGQGNCRALTPGYRFDLAEHYRKDANQAYRVLSVTHEATTGSYETAGADQNVDYRNSFVAMPHSDNLEYRPPHRAHKPLVHGSQSALVVGPSGEEIYVDKYGRIKVQFFWDRDGKKNETSSCWVRVATTWAGKSWGFIQLPRIGQEVIVDFLEGDPDQPIVTGRMYNAEQMPPYELPANKTQSGVKAHSSKEGTADANEFRFEDKKDAEEVFLRAQKDFKVFVKGSQNWTVDEGSVTTTLNKGSYTHTISKGDETRAIKEGKQTLTLKGDQATTIESGNQTLDIKSGKQTVTIKGNQSTTLSDGDQVLEIKMGKQTVTIQGNQAITIKQGNQELNVKMGNVTTKVDMGNVSTKAAMGKVSIEGMQGIELKVGQNSIKIDQTGISMKGMMIKLKGDIQTAVEGTITDVKGSGMLKLGGGVTMIG